jgi:Tfp pilus assembly protein PilF
MSYVEDGEFYLRNSDFSAARKCFGYARRENPNDWRAWFGLACVVTKNFSVHTGENWERFVDTARSLATPDAIAMINARVGDYAERQRILKEMKRARR